MSVTTRVHIPVNIPVDRWMVFDVESTSLHGEGFAVGWVCIEQGRVAEEGIAVAKPSEPVSHFVHTDVLPNLPASMDASARTVRDRFWEVWRRWSDVAAWLAADVPWPVEARFLAACIDDDRGSREFLGPYPLVDIASVRLAVGLDPLAVEERLPGERPPHNPLADAQQSARLLLEALHR